ncbi:MAG: thioredoxin [Paludibacter sp.]|jgi:thioredoxin|nr:thioredoxin [Paludibacter sp.]
MKKIVFASILLAFALSACAGKNSEKKSEEINQQKEVKKMGTIHLTKAEFLSKVANYEANPTEWKYLGDKPCIIDFYASWCGPCKTIAPILEDLAKEYDGQIYIYKINTEEEQELAAAFGIRSIPSILFCPMTGAPQMAQGALPKDAFKQAITDVLLKK